MGESGGAALERRMNATPRCWWDAGCGCWGAVGGTGQLPAMGLGFNKTLLH